MKKLHKESEKEWREQRESISQWCWREGAENQNKIIAGKVEYSSFLKEVVHKVKYQREIMLRQDGEVTLIFSN